ncbi:virulence factor MVIN family protein [Xylanimonas cellulosilytica DSM 15894]|uniref:Virulence factor MVIN family protein n=1 Tax=Xylanimonas cellulosilytica (strain DSM 15894 / JCM 12276 / CECT 5975 / KCTC 9989 / LMG 20990 / NBRC 107835 / XIL07) TaxID=446471 RepID=D1BRC2_XYLCX|nr:lipid II flippase MurJ [Xylanimonas cellulosilytica]ACZ30377.1 virulence factor MVIN family protein [Xylanimonas cellulosilytica DSM 15894]
MTQARAPRAQTVASAALLITLVTLASRVVGFGRWLAQGWSLGSDALGNAFNTANGLPNILFEVAAGGALAGAIIPLVAGPLSRAAFTADGTAEARAIASRNASAFLGWALAVLVPIGVLVAVLAHPIAGLLVTGQGPAVDVVTAFLRVFALQIPLYGVAVVLGAVLQAHRRFFWPAFAPLVSSVVVIGVYLGFLLFGENPRDLAALSGAALNWLAWGTTAGVAFLVVPLLWPTYRTGLRLRPTLRFPVGEGARAARLAFAGIGAVVAQQVSVLVVILTSNSISDATLPVFNYTQQVYLLPYAVLAFPIATSAFPAFTEHAAHQRLDKLRSLVASTTRALLLAAAAGVAMLVAAAPQVGAVFDLMVRGDAPGMVEGLTWMAPGIVGFALILHLSRVLYAIDRGRAAVVTTAVGWLVVTTGIAIAPAVLGPAPAPSTVLAWFGGSMTVGMAVAGVGLLVAVRRHLGAAALRGVPVTLAVLALGVVVGGLVARLVPTRVTEPFNGEVRFDGAALAANLGLGATAAIVALAVLAAVSLADAGLRGRVLAVVGGARQRLAGR